MEYAHLTAEDKAHFWDNGFIVRRSYFDGLSFPLPGRPKRSRNR